MDYFLASLALVTCAGLCFLIGFPAARLLRHFRVVDVPNQRSSHAKPTIRGGGIAIVFVVLAAGTALVQDHPGGPLGLFLLGALLIAAISFWDDVKSLPAGARLCCHALAAIGALAALGWPGVPPGPFPGQELALPQWAGAAMLFLWIVGYTNAFNFMDGINGLAAGQTVVTGIAMAILARADSGHPNGMAMLFCLVLSGAAAGFLPHNFPGARMFMGDVSSAPLGYLLAATVCWLGLSDGGRLMLPLILLHANFILDPSITMIRRLFRGEKLSQSHREHFYQRLIRSGRSHAYVTLWETALQLVAAGALIVSASPGGSALAWTGIAVIAMWTGFFLCCDRAFRSREPQAAPAKERKER